MRDGDGIRRLASFSGGGRLEHRSQDGVQGGQCRCDQAADGSIAYQMPPPGRCHQSPGLQGRHPGPHR